MPNTGRLAVSGEPLLPGTETFSCRNAPSPCRGNDALALFSVLIGTSLVILGSARCWFSLYEGAAWRSAEPAIALSKWRGKEARKGMGRAGGKPIGKGNVGYKMLKKSGWKADPAESHQEKGDGWGQLNRQGIGAKEPQEEVALPKRQVAAKMMYLRELSSRKAAATGQAAGPSVRPPIRPAIGPAAPPAGETGSKGFVANWYFDKGFGFIRPDEGGEDIFCHVHGVVGGDGSIKEGDEVTYVLQRDKRRNRLEAVNVCLDPNPTPRDRVEGNEKPALKWQAPKWKSGGTIGGEQEMATPEVRMATPEVRERKRARIEKPRDGKGGKGSGDMASSQQPPDFENGAVDNGYTEGQDGWWSHEDGVWFFNRNENLYWHMPTQNYHCKVNGAFELIGTDEALQQRLRAPVDVPEWSEDGAADNGGYTKGEEEREGWWSHASGEWLFNPNENLYWHVPTERYFAKGDGGYEVVDSVGKAVKFQKPRLLGRMRFFNKVKGFGFLVPMRGDEYESDDDIFVHRRDIQIDTNDDMARGVLQEDGGSLVSYSLRVPDKDGRVSATEVRPEAEAEEMQVMQVEEPEDEARMEDEVELTAPRAAPEVEERWQGRVKSWHAVKGFGFLEPVLEGNNTTDNEGDLFVHRNDIELDMFSQSSFEGLQPGTLVSYNKGRDENGRAIAIQVKLETSKAAEDERAAAAGWPKGLDVFEQLHAGVFSLRGAAHINGLCEDRFVVKEKLPINLFGYDSSCTFFGVFDGHCGHSASQYCVDNLARNILSCVKARDRQVNLERSLRAALVNGFKQTDKNFLMKARKASDQAGTTAVTMTVVGPDERYRLRLFLANAGDSRAVLGKADGTAVRLTKDAKPNDPDERKRILAAGGTVDLVAGTWRLMLPWEKREDVLGLAVSRGLGDKCFKAAGKFEKDMVSGEPEISIHDVNWEEDEIVILASDGVWDMISDEVAVLAVQSQLRRGASEETAAEELVKLAEAKGHPDDKTVIVVRFGWIDAEKGFDIVDLEKRLAELAAAEAAANANATQREGMDEEVILSLPTQGRDANESETSASVRITAFAEDVNAPITDGHSTKLSSEKRYFPAAGGGLDKQAFTLGDAVEYYNASQGCWTDAIVIDTRPSGELMLSNQRATWLSIEEVTEHVRLPSEKTVPLESTSGGPGFASESLAPRSVTPPMTTTSEVQRLTSEPVRFTEPPQEESEVDIFADDSD